jgi:hypothetical protein
MTIWKTAVKYNLNKISKAEAKLIIENITLKPVEQYSKCVQRDLGVILAKEQKPKRGKRAELPVLDDASSITTVELIDIVAKELHKDEAVVETEPAISNEAHEVVNKTEE